MRERGIGCNDLDQTPVEQLDVDGEPPDTAPRKTLQHRVFQQSRGVLSGDFLGTELAANSEHLGQLFGCRRWPPSPQSLQGNAGLIAFRTPNTAPSWCVCGFARA
jgi:hypothetical protein